MDALSEQLLGRVQSRALSSEIDWWCGAVSTLTILLKDGELIQDLFVDSDELEKARDRVAFQVFMCACGRGFHDD